MSYVRFIVEATEDSSGTHAGIFQAMYRLSRRGSLALHEEAWWVEVKDWFNANLEKPERLARSRRAGAEGRAISWFKDSATEHIRRAREIVALLQQHDIAARFIVTDRPGYIVYEDEYQVTAEPFMEDL